MSKTIENTVDAQFAFFKYALWNGLNEAGKEGKVYPFLDAIWNDFDAFATPNDGYDAAKALMGELGITTNRKEYDTYNNAVNNQQLLKLLSAANFNRELYAFLVSVRRVRAEVEEIRKRIQESGAVQHGDLLVVSNVDNPFFELYAEDMKDITKVCYSQLVTEYEEKMGSKLVDKKLFWSTEVREFDRLFNTGESIHGWEYMASRLNCSQDEIAELHANRVPVSKGDYITCLFEKDPHQRIIFGKLWAIQEYRHYLLEHSPQERFGTDHDQTLSYKPTIPVIDPRIPLEQEQVMYIKDCFYLLALDKHGRTTGTPWIVPDNIDKLLRKHFIGFGDNDVDRDLFDCPMENTHLGHFLRLVFDGLVSSSRSAPEIYQGFKEMMYSFRERQHLDSDSVRKYFNQRQPAKFPSYFETKIKEYKQRLNTKPS